MTFASNAQPRKPAKEKPKPWMCGCKVENPGYLVWCGRCGEGRP